MTPKENMTAALECRVPQAVPIWELEFHPWDAVSGQHLVLGREFEKLSPAQQDIAICAKVDLIARVSRELRFAALSIPGDYWEVAPGEPAYYWLPGAARMETARRLVKALGSEIMLVALDTAVICMPGASDYEAFSYRLFDAPEEIDEQCRKTLKWGIDSARRFRDLGIAAICTASDIADNHGLFFNPQQMQRFILPYLGQWSTALREMGLYTILHTDGNIAAALDDIAATGVHALQAIDPIAGMDIAATKRQVAGRLCLCGNIDCGLLERGDEAAIHRSTAETLRQCRPGGGYVLGASNAVLQTTPAAHYQAMVRAWEEWGQ